jgi:hypothetical protein
MHIVPKSITVHVAADIIASTLAVMGNYEELKQLFQRFAWSTKLMVTAYKETDSNVSFIFAIRIYQKNKSNMAPRRIQRQATNRGQLSGRALDQYRGRITKLYKIEKRPLNEVMRIIGQESKMDVSSMFVDLDLITPCLLN